MLNQSNQEIKEYYLNGVLKYKKDKDGFETWYTRTGQVAKRACSRIGSWQEMKYDHNDRCIYYKDHTGYQEWFILDDDGFILNYGNTDNKKISYIKINKKIPEGIVEC